MFFIVRAILILSLICYFSAQANYHHKKGKNHLYSKRILQLLRQLQTDGNQQSLETIGDCSSDAKVGFKWNGKSAFYTFGVDNAQRCLDLCDVNGKCLAWSYEKNSKLCDGWFDIEGISINEGAVSGSCVGDKIKTKCTDVQNGAFWGWLLDKNLRGAPDVQTCMDACDKIEFCYAWHYAASEKLCLFYKTASTFYTSNSLKGGRCVGKPERVIAADPIKLFRTEVLDRHNLKRKDHCVSELKLDSNLNKISQEIAQQLADDDKEPPVYNGDKMVNIYYAKANAALQGGVVVDNLYNEVKYFNRDNPKWSSTNHFPKIVWKSSTKLGVGRSFASNGITMYVVMTYDWEGDMTSSYKENVPQKCV